jgi:hypothetical protein
MPRYDGMGPENQGPLTGRGEGYCAVKASETGRVSGLLGFRNRPFYNRWTEFLGNAFGRSRNGGGRGRGRGAGRRRGQMPQGTDLKR